MRPNSTFYSPDRTEQEFIDGALSAQLESLGKACLYYNLTLDIYEILPVIQKYFSYSLKDCPINTRLHKYLEISHEFTTLFLPSEIRTSFRSVLTMELFRLTFGVELKLKDIKINIFKLPNTIYGKDNQQKVWSDFRRDTSKLANYWVENFFERIKIDSDEFKILKKTGLDFTKTFEPLRTERQQKDSLHVAICAVSMVLAGGVEDQPLSPILAIAKLYHEYLYYLNSIFDNKHGIHPLNSNYEEKVKDYSLASNLVFTYLNHYLGSLKEARFINENQHNQIVKLLQDATIQIMLIWFNDINSDVTQYVYTEYSPQQKTEILQMWIEHAMQMTSVWTKFFSLMGAVAANENYEQTVTKTVIEMFGELWGVGQIINGFKDFTVEGATADDIREKRCTPQILHALFHSNPQEKQFIIDSIISASSQKRDLTIAEKQNFVDIFNRIGTFSFLQGYVDRAILKFWSAYNSDNILMKSLIQRNLNCTMHNVINGGLESWFKNSRYFGK